MFLKTKSHAAAPRFYAGSHHTGSASDQDTSFASAASFFSMSSPSPNSPSFRFDLSMYLMVSNEICIWIIYVQEELFKALQLQKLKVFEEVRTHFPSDIDPFFFLMFLFLFFFALNPREIYHVFLIADIACVSPAPDFAGIGKFNFYIISVTQIFPIQQFLYNFLYHCSCKCLDCQNQEKACNQPRQRLHPQSFDASEQLTRRSGYLNPLCYSVVIYDICSWVVWFEYWCSHLNIDADTSLDSSMEAEKVSSHGRQFQRPAQSGRSPTFGKDEANACLDLHAVDDSI